MNPRCTIGLNRSRYCVRIRWIFQGLVQRQENPNLRKNEKKMWGEIGTQLWRNSARTSEDKEVFLVRHSTALKLLCVIRLQIMKKFGIYMIARVWWRLEQESQRTILEADSDWGKYSSGARILENGKLFVNQKRNCLWCPGQGGNQHYKNTGSDWGDLFLKCMPCLHMSHFMAWNLIFLRCLRCVSFHIFHQTVF